MKSVLLCLFMASAVLILFGCSSDKDNNFDTTYTVSDNIRLAIYKVPNSAVYTVNNTLLKSFTIEVYVYRDSTPDKDILDFYPGESIEFQGTSEFVNSMLRTYINQHQAGISKILGEQSVLDDEFIMMTNDL